MNHVEKSLVWHVISTKSALTAASHNGEKEEGKQKQKGPQDVIMYSSSELFYLGNGKARRRRKIILATYSRTVIATTTRLGRPIPSFPNSKTSLAWRRPFFFSFFLFSILHARLSGFGDFIRRLFSSKNPRTLFLDSKRKFSRKVQLANVPGQYFFGGQMLFALFSCILCA